MTTTARWMPTFIAVCCIPAALFAGTVAVPHTFANGAVAQAADVNANFGALATAVEQAAPSGSIVAYGGATAPAGWLLCNGAAVSRTTYAALFAAIGTAHGQGDGSTTFNLPDTRGLFLRGVDGAAARDPDVAARTAAATGGNTGNAVGSVQLDALKSHGHSVSNGSTSLGFNPGSSGTQRVVNSGAADGNNTVTAQATGGSETRPKNLSVHYLIKI